MAGFESMLNRFKFARGICVRGESFNQQAPADRNRVRVRLGVGGKSGDFTGGLALATGTLGDPTTTNETLTNNFARKTIALDRAYIRHFGADTNRSQPAPGLQQTAPTLFTINLPGEEPGYSNPKITLNTDAIQTTSKTITVPANTFTGPGITNCVSASNGMTSAIIFTRTVDAVFGNVTITNQRFASGFLYADFILQNTFKTPFKRLPLNLNLEFEDNLDAVAHPYGTTFDPITQQLVQSTNLGSLGKAYGLDVSVGQLKNKGDFQIAYAYLRQEQDSAIASFVESDQRVPTNILQHRFYALYRMNPNTVVSFTFWRGRTLTRGWRTQFLWPGVKTARWTRA